MKRRILAIFALLAIGFAAGYFAARRPAPPAVRQFTTDEIESRVLPRVQLQHATLREAIEYVRKTTGLDIAATWPTDARGISLDTAFDPDLWLHDVTIGEFISRLNQTTGKRDGAGIDFAVQDGFIRLRPATDAPGDFGPDADARPSETITCVYDVEKLVLADGPWEKLAVLPRDDSLDLPANIKQRGDFVVVTLRNLIDPDSWKDAGGKYGSARVIGGKLIVTQTVPKQRAIYEIIKTLRAAN